MAGNVSETVPRPLRKKLCELNLCEIKNISNSNRPILRSTRMNKKKQFENKELLTFREE